MTPQDSVPAILRGRARLILAVVVLATLAGATWAVVRADLFPPHTIVMATGPEGGSWKEQGDRYRRILAAAGVDLRLETTTGGVANLVQLRDPRSGVVVAFVQGGLADSAAAADLISLGTVALDPLWVFGRFRSSGTVAQRFNGKRISIGQQGGATRVMARRFLQLNSADERTMDLPELTHEQSADSLEQGAIDATVMLTGWRAPAVQQLLAAEGVVLESFPRADAYVARFPVLTKVVLPMGAADLTRNIPPADVQLVAVKVSLVARRDLHPALQYVLLQAAAEIHGGPDIFHSAGEFPAPEAIDLPLSGPARQFYASGLPFAYRLLPFRVAGLAEPLLVLLIPLIALVLPVVRLLPEVYRVLVERRIFRLYGELKGLEMELERHSAGAAPPEVVAELDQLARRANHLRVPLAYAQRLFILKSHIALAQQEAAKRGGTGAGIPSLPGP